MWYLQFEVSLPEYVDCDVPLLHRFYELTQQSILLGHYSPYGQEVLSQKTTLIS